MVFTIELLKHTINQYGIVQLQNLRIRVVIVSLRFSSSILLEDSNAGSPRNGLTQTPVRHLNRTQ